MKAVTVNTPGGPEVLQIVQKTLPPIEKNQVLVKLEAVGVNPVETYIRSGTYGPITPGYTPGTDGAGVVEEIGADVTKVAVGDRVYLAGSVTGTYAESCISNEEQVWKLPEILSFKEGAAIGIPYATAWRALFIKANAKPGDSVLIHGASGAVGTAAVQLARAAGLTVIGTAGTEEGREHVLMQGAHFVLDHTRQGYLEEVVEKGLRHLGQEMIKPKQGFDIIIEMLANENLDRDLDAAAKKGIIVVVGNRGRTEIDARKIMAKEITVTGMLLLQATPNELNTIHTSLADGFNKGKLKPIISKTFTLDEAAQAHEAVMQSGAKGKIIISI